MSVPGAGDRKELAGFYVLLTTFHMLYNIMMANVMMANNAMYKNKIIIL
jgi:hypothetical protein